MSRSRRPSSGLADLLIVAARTGDDGRGGVTLFLVEANTPGISFGRPLAKMGWHSSDTREVILDGVTVAADAVLGQVDRGFYQIMEAFQLERISDRDVVSLLALDQQRARADDRRQHSEAGDQRQQLQPERLARP